MWWFMWFRKNRIKEIVEDERIVNFVRGFFVYDGSDSNFIIKIKEDFGI